MLTAEQYWSKAFQRTFRGLALPSSASHSIMCANLDTLCA
jgi:hypothetical protein